MVGCGEVCGVSEKKMKFQEENTAEERRETKEGDPARRRRELKKLFTFARLETLIYTSRTRLFWTTYIASSLPFIMASYCGNTDVLVVAIL